MKMLILLLGLAVVANATQILSSFDAPDTNITGLASHPIDEYLYALAGSGMVSIMDYDGNVSDSWQATGGYIGSGTEFRGMGINPLGKLIVVYRVNGSTYVNEYYTHGVYFAYRPAPDDAWGVSKPYSGGSYFYSEIDDNNLTIREYPGSTYIGPVSVPSIVHYDIAQMIFPTGIHGIAIACEGFEIIKFYDHYDDLHPELAVTTDDIPSGATGLANGHGDDELWVSSPDNSIYLIEVEIGSALERTTWGQIKAGF